MSVNDATNSDRRVSRVVALARDHYLVQLAFDKLDEPVSCLVICCPRGVRLYST
jgi:hypothetical protein